MVKHMFRCSICRLILVIFRLSLYCDLKYKERIHMKARAAVAWAVKQPLEIEEVEVMGPKQGEVLLKVIASGICHTDAFTLSGEDPEGAFPCILGKEKKAAKKIKKEAKGLFTNDH